MRRIRSKFGFIGDVVGELKKVMWPSRSELVRLTLMVIATCIVTAVILGLVDYGFGKLVRDVIGG